METENLGGGGEGAGERRGESNWPLAPLACLAWLASTGACTGALRKVVFGGLPISGLLAGPFGRAKGVWRFRGGWSVGLLVLWAGILGVWAEPFWGGFEGVGGAVAGVWSWGGNAAVANAARGGNATRVRRGPRGRLGFGTFEAWCHSHPSGAGEWFGDGRWAASVVGVSVPTGAGVRVPAVAGGCVPAGLGGRVPGNRFKGTSEFLGDFAPVVFKDEVCFPVEGALQRDAPLEVEASRSRVPPSLKAVVRYFEEALGEDPVYEEGGKFRFERWEGFAWGASWRRALVSGGGGAVCLEWWTNDDFGVSELREFFEAPFFELSESLVLHQWMSEGGWHSGVLRGARLAMGVLARGDYVYVRIRWWQPPV